MNKAVFNMLKRKGECWHDRRSINPNPDFTTWEGFGWMWERAQEQDWWGAFLIHAMLIDIFEPPDLSSWVEYMNPAKFMEALHAFGTSTGRIKEAS